MKRGGGTAVDVQVVQCVHRERVREAAAARSFTHITHTIYHHPRRDLRNVLI